MSTIATMAGDLRYRAARGVVDAMMRLAASRGDVGALLMRGQPGTRRQEVVEQVRRTGRLVPALGGFVTVDHEAADRVLRDPAFAGFNHGLRATGGKDTLRGRLLDAALFDPVNATDRFTDVPSPIGPMSLIGSHTPDHTRIRRVVNRAFLPSAIAGWRHRIEAIAAELADEALASARRDGAVDVVTSFAGPFPIQVICELLGIPVKDRARFRAWGNAVAGTIDPMTPATQRTAVAALEEMSAYFAQLYAQRRAEPGDAVIDLLLAANDGDTEAGLSDDEVLATTLLVLVAGFETTVNLIGNAVHLLGEHPDQLDLLLDDQDLVPDAVEEVLRFDPPVQTDGRVALRDTEVLGEPIPTGTGVTISIAGANRDPAVFEAPATFDVTRDDAARHLAFAAGMHYCLGATLARVEGDVALRALLDRFGRFTVPGPAVRRPTFTLSGFDRLVVAPGRTEPAVSGR